MSKRKYEGKNEDKHEDIASKIMRKMGFVDGRGLGKDQQGPVNPIETSTQRGRRGLGYILSDIKLDPSVCWDQEREQYFVSVHEQVDWCPEPPEEPLDIQEMKTWIEVGPQKLTIDDEVHFCEPSVVKDVVMCKNVFDHLSGPELRNARSMSNPFESIGKTIFQNRAALKMANIEAVFDFMFTDPRDDNGCSLLNKYEPLYFADICAGPGGFSEYVLWKKGWEAKGFGFTLKGENDFKLNEFFAGTPETFEPHYGVGGVNGDGDIFNPRNLVEFRDFVLQNTEKRGVHFVMADGGFSVEGRENIQEILSKRLYLCQFVCALSIIRPGGHFVCKLFDIFTPFSVGLIFLMYRSFERIAIHKPNSSRPANSERYIVCKSKHGDTTNVENFLFEINCRLDSMDCQGVSDDILKIVSMETLKSDEQFFDYIYKSNTQLGKRQVHFLLKVKAFAEDSSLKEVRQGELKKDCLEYWGVPNKSRVVPSRPDPQTKFRELVSTKSPVNDKFYGFRPALLVIEKLKELDYPWSFKCVILCSEESNANAVQRGFFLGLGGHNVHFWNGSSSTKWRKVDAKVFLPPDTLIYGEKVQELKGEGKAQRHTEALHIIDSLFLGGMDVRFKSFDDRVLLTRKLVKAITKTSVSDRTTVRMKHVYDLENLEKLYNDIDMKELKSITKKARLCHQIDNDWFIVPGGVLMLNTLKSPWSCKMSNSTGKLYYFNYRKKGNSIFECPEGAIADFEYSFSNCFFWKWCSDNDIMESDFNCSVTDPSHLTRNILKQHLNKVLGK